MQSSDELAAAYLRQIQPRDSADLASHVHHDLSMLVNSFSSYLELLENILTQVTFPEPLVKDFHTYVEDLHGTIPRFYEIMNYYSADISSMVSTTLVGWVSSDLRNPIGIFRGYVDLLQYDLKANPSLSVAYQRAVHLVDAMQATIERMIVIGNACLSATRNMP